MVGPKSRRPGISPTDFGALLAAISDGSPVAPYLVTGWTRAARMATMLNNLQRLGCGGLISPGAGDYLVAIDSSGVAISDDGIRLVASSQGDMLLDDGASPAGTTILRLWQSNMVALQGARSVNWTSRPGEGAWMSGAGSPVLPRS
jgi:hypothetical protein